MRFRSSPEQAEQIREQLAMLDDGIRQNMGRRENWELEYNKALILLSDGQFDKGWKLYDRRFSLPEAKFGYHHFPVKRWDGENLAGKHIWLWLEQGIGDQILTVSMLPDLIKAVKGGSITVLGDRYMVDVFRRSFPSVKFYKTGDVLTERERKWIFDYQLTQADLGRMFRLKRDDFPGTPYLKYDASLANELRRKYSQPGKKIVGIGWSSTSTTTGQHKTMNLAQMAPVLKAQDCVFVDLQYGDHEEELAQAKKAGLNIIHDESIDQLCDMDDFFAQVAAMDMVVSTSQTLVHVAGSIGKETHVILPRGSGRLWYWFAEMSESPWYNSIRLYRQGKPGDWSIPVNEIANMMRQRQPMCLTA